MKIDRLLGIITLLLQKNKLTAPELARHFEVSKRTILRDIDAICQAGIPIVTYPGGNGGIAIAEGFKLDKNVLSTDELASILAGLKSLGSVTDHGKMTNLITKLSPKTEAIPLADPIYIDLASHYKSSLSDKIGLFRKAIQESKRVAFDYYSEKGMSRRIIEPYYITYKWTAWYVYGYCTEKEDFRLFKLNRLWNHVLLEETFITKMLPEEGVIKDYFQDEKEITVLFDPGVRYRLVEDYGPECFEVMEDGVLKFHGGFTNTEFMLSWILSFGDKARVIAPEEWVEIMKEKAKKMNDLYERDI